MAEETCTVALDAGLVSSSQAVEHYEIARYGTLQMWVGQLRLTHALRLRSANLREEITTDLAISDISNRGYFEDRLAGSTDGLDHFGRGRWPVHQSL